jgi:hypothetical protein
MRMLFTVVFREMRVSRLVVRVATAVRVARVVGVAKAVRVARVVGVERAGRVARAVRFVMRTRVVS